MQTAEATALTSVSTVALSSQTSGVRTHFSHIKADVRHDRASINTAALAFESANASTVETFRVDCEQVDSDWDRCHEGQECMDSTELLNVCMSQLCPLFGVIFLGYRYNLLKTCILATPSRTCKGV